MTDPQPPAPRLRAFACVALAVAIGAAGGLLFAQLTIPLPWMLGSMALVTAAAMLGAPVRMSMAVRQFMSPVIGVLLGSAFTPEMAARMTHWAVTLGAMTLWIGVAAGLVLLYYRKVARFGPVTAYFSAMPGGLSEMVLAGGSSGGDMRAISLMHTARVLLVVFTIPIWYRLQGGLTPAAQAGNWVGFAIAPLDVAILVGCGVLGALGAQRLRIPAGVLFGPMVLSAAAQLSGLTHSSPPTPVVNLAQLVIGVMVGCRFVGLRWREFVRLLLHSIPTTAIMTGTAVAVAMLLAPLTGFPLAALVLALAPGGMAEMSLVALALGVDPAFVACHHVARLAIVVSTAPLVFRLWGVTRTEEPS